MAGCYYYFHKYYPEYDPVFWRVKTGKTLESPVDSKEIKPVNPKGNQPWLFTGGLMLKLKLQYFGHLMGRANSLEQTLMLEKIEGRRRRGRQRLRWLDGPLLFLPSIFPIIGVFSNELVLVSDGQSVEALASVLPMNIQSWFPLGLTDLISLQSKGLSRVFSNTTI